VGQIQRLGAIPLVLPLLLSRRTPAYHLPHGVSVANSRTWCAEVLLIIIIVVVVTIIIIIIVIITIVIYLI